MENNNNKIISINKLLELVEKDAKLSATLEGFGKELTRLNDCYENLKTKIDDLRTKDIPQLKIDFAKRDTKSTVLWGLAGGAIPVAIGLVIFFMSGG